VTARPLRRPGLLLVVALAATVPWLVRAAGAFPGTTSSATDAAQLIAITGPAPGKSLTGFDLVTLTRNGQDLQRVAPASGGLRLSDFVFTWSPDGKSIAYPCSKSINDERYAICIVNVATGETHQLTHAPSLGIEPFAWGPKNQIAGDCNKRDVCFVDAKTGQITWITKTGTSARDAYVFGNDVVWSPDGRTVAFTCRRNDQQDRRFCFVGQDHKLTIQPRSWNSVELQGWTQDSQKIVWWGRFSGNQPLTYHEQSLDGSDLKPLPKQALVRGPHYSSDGRWRLVDVRGSRPGLGEEPVSGGRTRMILSNAGPWEYAFQP
jgi:dipeptidyl aminopeptidase/acylaminoacyl peptidase